MASGAVEKKDPVAEALKALQINLMGQAMTPGQQVPGLIGMSVITPVVGALAGTIAKTLQPTAEGVVGTEAQAGESKQIPGAEPTLPRLKEKLTGAQLLTPRTLAYRQRVAREKAAMELRAKPLGIQIPKKAFHGLLWFADQFDRPRNAMMVGWWHYLNGERDPGKLANYMLPIPGSPGWTGDERASFENIIETLGSQYQTALFYPFAAAGVSQETARRIMGFGGDMVLDPLNFLGEAPWKAAKVGSKFAMEGLRKIGAAEGVEQAMRQFIVRGSGFPLVDKLNEMRISENDYYKSGLMNDAQKLFKQTRGLRQYHKDIISKVAEETNIEDAISFIRAAKAQPTGANAPYVVKALSNFERFRNPEAIRKAIQLRDPKFIDQVEIGARGLRFIKDKARSLELAQGYRGPTLGERLTYSMQQIAKQYSRTVEEVMDKAILEQTQKIESARAVLAGKDKVLREVIGKEKLKSIHQAILQQTSQGGALNQNAFEAILKQYLASLHPGIVSAFKSTVKDQTAIAHLISNVQNEAMSAVSRSARLASLQAKWEKKVELMSRMPNYVVHVTNPEWADRIAKLPAARRANLLQQMRSPDTASAMIRKFAEQERPLSFEEVMDVINSGELRGKTKGALAPGIVFKKQGLKARVMNQPKELADFFNADEYTVASVMAQRSAKSISTAAYLNRAARTFGKHASQLTPAEMKGPNWIRMGEISGLEHLDKTMPQLRKVFLPVLDPSGKEGLAQAIVQNLNIAENPHKVLQIYDRFLDWHKRTTLLPWPAYHLRNSIGNVINMMHAGMFDIEKPWTIPGDMHDWMKVNVLQHYVRTNDIAGMKRLRFELPNNASVTGEEFLDMAMRRGVPNTGWYGGEIPTQLEDRLSRRFASVASINPLSKHNIAFRAGGWWGKNIEDNARMTLFANRLRKGDDAYQSAATVKKFLGDFRSEVMTPFERNVLGRMFFFYRWNRFNIPLQVETLLKSGRSRRQLLAILRGQRTFLSPETQIDASQLPSDTDKWIAENAGIQLQRTKQGEIRWLLMNGLHPTFDLNQLVAFDQLTTDFFPNIARWSLNQVTPLAQVWMESGTGRSLYQDELLNGHNKEFLGKIRPSWQVALMRRARFLSTLDYTDPFGKYHIARRYSKPTWTEKGTRLLGGLTMPRTNPVLSRLQYDQEGLDWLRQEVGLVSSYNRGLRERKRKEKEKK